MSTAAALEEILEQSNLTGRQLLIYTGQKLHPELALYNSVYRIGWRELDPQRFRTLWQRVVEACDALRIVIEEKAGIPQQRVVDPQPVVFDIVDLRTEGMSITSWIAARLRRPLDLTRQIYDTALLRTDENQYTWFLHIHHVVVDGAGVQALIRYVSESYGSGRATPAGMPSFMVYAARMCALRKTEDYRLARAHWQRYLQQVPQTPRFYGIESNTSTAQQRVIFSLDAGSSKAAIGLARSLASDSVNEHAVLSNLFNAVFAAFLMRVANTTQIAIGMTFHNRSTQEERTTVGLFMEVLPLLLQSGPQETLLSLMPQVASAAVQARRHRLYSVGHSDRSPAFSALFNYMRSLWQAPAALEVRRVHPGYGSNTLSLSVAPQAEGFELWLDVSAEIAASSSAQRIARQLHTLLAAAVREPHKPLAYLPLLEQDQIFELLRSCTGPQLPIPASKAGCLQEFMLQTVTAAHAPALVCGAVSLTYAELNQRVDQLVQRLRAAGARRGRRVAICLERSAEMVIAVLATLKSGAAYVPLDPGYPQERLRLMLADAGPQVLITTAQLTPLLPAYRGALLLLDAGGEASSAVAGPALAIEPEDPAYVIYTSGTTGTPKGVLVTHANLSNHLAWRRSFFPLTGTDSCLQSASLCFDDSVWEILEPLSSGAQLVLTRPRFEYDSAYLVRLMAERRITVACFVPSLLRTIIETPGIECCGLRRLTTGGEGLSLALQQRVRERLPATAFYNGYGTTEGTIASLYWRCELIADQRSVPIGRPIANTHVFVLDSAGQLVPPGVIGELHIGGAGVAQGYLNRPELTAERFVPDHIAGNSGARLYCTGDLGRLRADGVFEFVGRSDDQIKIRGIRVELGDIEAALLRHPAVMSAAVVCQDSSSGKRLSAFVTTRNGTVVPAGELRNAVAARLPAALVPNRFATLPALPLTSHGKLDRRTLLGMAAPEEKSCHVDARTALEARLVQLWEEVLEFRPIGVTDDFFELGGHSLSAVQLAAALATVSPRPVPPGVLFEAPTIEQLAHRLSCQASADHSLVLLASGGPDEPLFLAHHVSGDITAYRDLAPYLGGNRPVYGLRAPELDTGASPPECIRLLAARYVDDIRTVQPRGPYLLGGHSAGAHIAFEIAQQLHAAGEPIALLAILEADARPVRGAGRSWLDRLRQQSALLADVPGPQRLGYLWQRITAIFSGDKLTATFPNPLAATQATHPAWSAMERAVRNYEPRSYPGALVLFRATDRSVTGTHSRRLGWQRLARGGVEVIDVEGSHGTVLRPGSEPPMAAKLRAYLEDLGNKQRRDS